MNEIKNNEEIRKVLIDFCKKVHAKELDLIKMGHFVIVVDDYIKSIKEL